MNGFNLSLLLLFGAGFLGLFWLLRKNTAGSGEKNLETELTRMIQENADIRARLEGKNVELGKLESELETEKSERNQLEGKGKQLFAEITGYREENKNLRLERDELKSRITKVETEETRKDKDFEKKMIEAENMRKSWEEEKLRIRREDEIRQQEILAEQNRIWNDHETLVRTRLREICQMPTVAFNFYENTKLPESFDGSLKPDGLIDFLGQYIIFDAKKSKDLVGYLNDQVKKTAEKIKKSPSVADIYATIFFVVPTEEMKALKKTFFYEDGYSFFVITPEALEAILASYKRITEYEKISEFDPQDREKIVELIARYDRHISFQNATNILLTKEGLGVMNSKENINAEVLTEIEVKKKHMRQSKLNEAELKRLTQNFSEQEEEMERMVTPKEVIEKKDLEEAQRVLL